MPVEAVAVAVGVVLVGAALAWRLRAHGHTTRLLGDALASPDPAVRIGALTAIGALGLSRHAGVVVDMAEREAHPEVIGALIEVVSRSQWEPADKPELVALRLQVAQWIASGRRADRAIEEPAEPRLVGEVRAALGQELRHVRLRRDAETITAWAAQGKDS